jgi:hypothetical protein
MFPRNAAELACHYQPVFLDEGGLLPALRISTSMADRIDLASTGAKVLISASGA